MLNYINTLFTNKIILTCFLVFFIGQRTSAQNLTGPSPVNANSIHTYTYSDGSAYRSLIWLVDLNGGTKLSTATLPGFVYTLEVQWGAAGAGTIVAIGGFNTLGTLNVTISGTTVPPPPTSITTLSDENYIHTLTPRVAATEAGLAILNDAERLESVTYFDGLGRPVQSVGIRAGGDGEDVITHIGYDNYGRQTKDYLPYTLSNNNGTYKTDALTATKTYYNASKYEPDFPSVALNDINAYSEKELEASPISRALKQAAPGKDWKLGGNHEIEFEYSTNIANEIRKYDVSLSYANNTYTPTLIGGTSYYNANELYKNVTKDENHDGTSSKNHTTEEFKDKQGRVILKRTYGTSKVNGVTQTNVAHDTYYVYNDYGNLTYVIPPKVDVSNGVSSTELSELCYQYKYDDRNRLVEKKIPGKDLEYIVYNKLDQPILTQDANLRAQNKWLVTKYDAFGRVAFTGIRTISISREGFQSLANGNNYTQYVEKTNTGQSVGGATIYYTNTAIPVGLDQIYTVNYYDDYTFDIGTGVSETAYGITPETNVKGLATGSKVRVLTTNEWITTVSYYDEKSRPIYVYSFNDYLDSTDKIKSQLDFTGQVLETTTTHTKNSTTITTYDYFTYDHVGRLLSQEQKVGSNANEMLAQNHYDELGQLESKGVGGKTTQGRLQDIDYTYTVRGWLKQINNPASLGNDLFGFKINYNTEDHGGNKLYNGNIAETEWKTANTDNSLKWYNYSYDALNRITSGISDTGNHNLYDVSYDKNGNIMTLKRKGNTGGSSYGTIDNLIYNYSNSNVSNKLQRVQDFTTSTEGFNNLVNYTTEYTYDSNGNMLTDANKGISSNIVYNHLNLPTSVNVGGGNISYIYDATGVKLKKVVSTGATTEYAGNYVYENSSLKFFNHPEGYFDVTGIVSGNVTGDYVYQYKDHLGNVRLSYKDSNNNGSVTSSEILEENNYYPFGLKHKGYNNNPTSSNIALKYKYANKELQDELGLNMYDYGARFYDPATARFNKIDRFAEKYDSNTPYAFVANSPIKYSDYNGDWIYINDGGNRYRYENGGLYSKNEETGEYDVKYKAAAGSYSATIAKTLSKLEGTLSGADLTGFFANDTDNVFIQQKAAGKKGNSQAGSFVKTDPNNKGAKVPTEDGVVETPFFVSLGHEIAHRRDLITNGNSIFSTWLTLSNGKTVKEAEKYASHIENMIRQENGLPLRTHYVLGRSPSGALSGFGPSALLNSNGNSNFFKAPATMEITDDNGNNAITIRLKTSTTQQYNYKNQSSYGTPQN